MSMQIQRLPSVLRATGHARSTLYLQIAQGLWVRPIKLGARSVGWPSDEVEALIKARISGSSEAAIKDLVGELQRKRSCKTGSGK